MKTERNQQASTLTLRGERCQCANCGHIFTGEKAFNRHRTGEYGWPAGHPAARRCKTTAEMRLSGMEETASLLWRVRPRIRYTVDSMPTAGQRAAVLRTLQPSTAAVDEPSGSLWASTGAAA